MSLVAYGSSDESENEGETNDEPQIEIKKPTSPVQSVNTNATLQLPTPKEPVNTLKDSNIEDLDDAKINFDTLPKTVEANVKIDLKETDNTPLPRKINYDNIEKPPKKEKGPTRITIPSLSDFKDLNDEKEGTSFKPKPSKTASGLISMLPPPKGSIVTTKVNSMVPHVLTKKPVETKKPAEIKTAALQAARKLQQSKPTSTITSLSNYNSDSEDEDEKGTSASGIDFFSLSAPTKIPDELIQPMSNEEINTMAFSSSSYSNVKEEKESNKTLVSNIMNLPKEEILLKNKAEVGPKLPVPEQEYNVDRAGNVAFDEKAIEYLCGKRGVKRKNEINNVDIIEISGEDIKPDEREWLVKALTEETPTRPMSANSGPGGQSKKKHQITYLAHQAKAMEIELKNQWAQNKASRQQTRSKYGF